MSKPLDHVVVRDRYGMFTAAHESRMAELVRLGYVVTRVHLTMIDAARIARAAQTAARMAMADEDEGDEE